MTKDLNDLNRRFVWTQDGLDTYRVLSAPEGKLLGDCDDFAVTALWLAEGKSMWRFWWALITFRVILWRVKGEGWASHMILQHKTLGFIDNQNHQWGALRDTRRFPVLFPFVAVKMLLGKIRGDR